TPKPVFMAQALRYSGLAGLPNAAEGSRKLPASRPRTVRRVGSVAIERIESQRKIECGGQLLDQKVLQRQDLGGQRLRRRPQGRIGDRLLQRGLDRIGRGDAAVEATLYRRVQPGIRQNRSEGHLIQMKRGSQIV